MSERVSHARLEAAQAALLDHLAVDVDTASPDALFP